MIPVSKYIIYVLPASRDQIPLMTSKDSWHPSSKFVEKANQYELILLKKQNYFEANLLQPMENNEMCY